MRKTSMPNTLERFNDPAIGAAKAGLLPSWSPMWQALTPWEWVEKSGDLRTRPRNDAPAGVGLTVARGKPSPVWEVTTDNTCSR